MPRMWVHRSMTQRENTKKLMEDIKRVCPNIKGGDLGYIAACIKVAYSTGAYESAKEMREIHDEIYGK